MSLFDLDAGSLEQDWINKYKKVRVRVAIKKVKHSAFKFKRIIPIIHGDVFVLSATLYK